MRKTITAIALAIGVALGGVTVAAPAQAIAGTDVYVSSAYANSEVGTENVNGWWKYLSDGETAHNVAVICPPGYAYYLKVTGPAGSTRVMDPGACYRPTNDGRYVVSQHWAL